MDIIIKAILQSIYRLLRPGIYRITENKRTAFNSKFEHYPSVLTDVSKKEFKGKHYLSVRVKQKSETRFSMLMPSTFSRAEKEYFLSRTWVNYFDDTRTGNDSPKEGLLIHWSDKALGTAELYDTCWDSINRLPIELIELHSTKDYLRVIFEGNAENIRKINTGTVKQELNDLKNSLAALPSIETKRRKFAFTGYALNFLFNASLLCIFAVSYVLLEPPVDYLDYQKGDNLVFIAAFVAIVPIFIKLFRAGNSIFTCLQYSVFYSFMSTMILFAIYLRLNFIFKTDASIETWRILKITEQRARHTKTVTGYNLLMSNVDKKWNKIFVKLDKLDNTQILLGKYAKINIYTDILGYKFADSIKVQVDKDKIERSVELIN